MRETHTAEDWAAVCSVDWQTNPFRCVYVCVGALSLYAGSWKVSQLVSEVGHSLRENESVVGHVGKKIKLIHFLKKRICIWGVRMGGLLP